MHTSRIIQVVLVPGVLLSQPLRQLFLHSRRMPVGVPHYFAAGNPTSGGHWNTLGFSVVTTPNGTAAKGISYSIISFSSNGVSVSMSEPSTIFLMGSGLAGLGLWRWKTKK